MSRAGIWCCLLLVPLAARPMCAQQQATPQPQLQTAPNKAPESAPAVPDCVATHTPCPATPPLVPVRDQRQAERDFREADKLIHKNELPEAEHKLFDAERLDPANTQIISRHAQVRAALVREYLEQARSAREIDDMDASSKALQKAEQLDPDNSLVQQEQLIQSQRMAAAQPVLRDPEDQLRIESGLITLDTRAGKQALHYRGSQRQLIEQSFQQFGIKASLDESVSGQPANVETEPLDFAQAARIVMLLTGCFYVPLDSHRVLVAKDTRANRQKFEREFVETIYLPGLTANEVQDTQNILRQVLQMQQVSALPAEEKITIRAPEETMLVANSLLRDLWRGNSQLLLTMTVYEVQRMNERNIGAQLPSQVALYNIPAEEASIFSQYASEIQQLIASGAVPAGDPLAIIAALVAGGILNTPPFNQGFVIFGGGLTQTALTTTGATGNLSMNSADVRQMDKIQLRVGNGETATFRNGSRYPIITSSFSSAINTSALAGANIPGYSSLVAAASSVPAAPPQIQYEDLGLTLKAKPTIQKDRAVTLNLELTITSLGGSSLNGNPVLNNREMKTVVTLANGEQSVLAGTLSRNESRALTGIPFLNDIPGFPGTNEDKALTSDEFVIVLTPHIVRLDHEGNASPLYTLTNNHEQ